jgi:hypothetical protein
MFLNVKLLIEITFFIILLFLELNETLLNEKIEKIVQERIASQLLINNERQSISTETILKEVIRSGDDLSILDRVRAMIREQIRKYDADRTGLPDYALESSGIYFLNKTFEKMLKPQNLGASVESTRCTVQYDEKSRTQKFFGIPLWYLSYSPRFVELRSLISKLNPKLI